MKYAYRLMKNTMRIQFDLEDVIFPVPDETKVGLHKTKVTKGLVEYMFVFNTRAEAELSIQYERHAVSCKRLTYKERMDLMAWECKRIMQYTQIKLLKENLGIPVTTPGRHIGRYIPSERSMARIKAIADILEKHFEQMKKELAMICPDDRVRKEEE